jgi:uncharacterized protein
MNDAQNGQSNIIVSSDEKLQKRQYKEYYQEPTRQLIFILTEKCNLDCIYCYEKRKNQSNVTLSADFIKDIIKIKMLAEDEYKHLLVIFFGGEPLLEYKTICEVVDWFKSFSWPIPSKACKFMVETNGTLLDDRMKEWFTRHREDVVLSLSLDGTKDAHDRNRCNSYDAVARHINFFQQNWPNQPVKMTIGPETIDQTYDGVVHISNLGLHVEFDVLFEDVWGGADMKRRAVRTWAEQLDKLVSFYHTHPGLPRPMVLSRRLEQLFDSTPRSQTFCGAGKVVTCFSTDGLEYPCFRFTSFIVKDPLFDVFSTPDLENEQCSSCPFEKICPTCEGNNYAITGSCFKRTSFHCDFFKVSLMCSAKLHLLDNPNDLYPPLDQPEEEKLRCMRRLLAIRVVNDLCGPVCQSDGLQT